jgi:DNA invertase Pin-like site-specific DNA recombinase
LPLGILKKRRFGMGNGEGRWAGRPRKMSEEQVALALQLYYVERMPVREVADALKLSHMTVWRAITRSQAEPVFNAYLQGWR